MTAVEAVVQHLSATPVVALAAGLLAMAVLGVFLVSFLFHRRSGRR